jgi:electron transfer flavoprotein beta subunit
MKVLACVKQVHDSAAATRIDDTGRWVVSHDGTSSRLNRYDEVAVEAALRLSESRDDVTTAAITVGPAWHERAVRRALGMGIDEGIHVITPGAAYEDASRIAAWIAAVVGPRGFDLILAGVESEDRMQGVTGPMVAALLDLPCATAVVALEVSGDGRVARVQRELEGGRRETVELDLPAVLTVQTGLARPRYPSLRHVLRGNRQPIETIPAATLAVPEPDSEIAGLAYPGAKRGGRILSGTAPEKAATLVALFREKGFLPNR